MNLHIDNIGGTCPVQAEGTINEYPFYFRARHDNWSFSVSAVGADPVEVPYSTSGFYMEEEYLNASFMSKEEAITIINRCAEIFIKDKE